MMQPVLLIQNDADEGAGLLATLLNAHGIAQYYRFGWELNDVPGADEYAALVVLGGVQSAYQTEKYPYLCDEMACIRTFLFADKPVLGLCLGAQLLASAIAGEVRANVRKELGFGDIALSAEAAHDPLMKGLPRSFPVFHFHGDYFPLPPNAVRLAASALTECQLFRHGSGYGFQFHLEIDQPLIEIMCNNNRDYMAENGSNADEVIAGSVACLQESSRYTTTILERWIAQVKEQS
jgi:GMP synthase (glutamine-hydrolysing)